MKKRWIESRNARKEKHKGYANSSTLITREFWDVHWKKMCQQVSDVCLLHLFWPYLVQQTRHYGRSPSISFDHEDVFVSAYPALPMFSFASFLFQLPDMKHVHDCLSRLIRERRLYHNGHGYFVISNDNVLNEIQRLTTNNTTTATTSMNNAEQCNLGSPRPKTVSGWHVFILISVHTNFCALWLHAIWNISVDLIILIQNIDCSHTNYSRTQNQHIHFLISITPKLPYLRFKVAMKLLRNSIT